VLEAGSVDGVGADGLCWGSGWLGRFAGGRGLVGRGGERRLVGGVPGGKLRVLVETCAGNAMQRLEWLKVVDSGSVTLRGYGRLSGGVEFRRIFLAFMFRNKVRQLSSLHRRTDDVQEEEKKE